MYFNLIWCDFKSEIDSEVNGIDLEVNGIESDVSETIFGRSKTKLGNCKWEFKVLKCPEIDFKVKPCRAYVVFRFDF